MSAFWNGCLKGLFASCAFICYAIGVDQQEYILAIAGGLFAIACALTIQNCWRRADNG